MKREEAIERIKWHMKLHQLSEERSVKITEALQMAIEALSADPKWIPCDTSGMPPEGEEVLVSDGKHIWIDETVAGDATEDGYMMWWGDGSDWIGTAWMPLPTPYKGGDAE